MSTGQVSNVFRSGLLALWALATLVLFFTVVLLAYEYYRAGNAGGGTSLTSIAPVQIETDPAQSIEETEITLYFGSTGTLELVPERRLVALTGSTIENCKRAFQEMASGPRSPLVRLLDSGASIRGAYLTADGILVLDVARGLNVPQVSSASAELLMVRSIVATLTQSTLRGSEGPAVRGVKFLYEGSVPTKQFPGHITLDTALVASRSWQTAEFGSADE